MINKDGLTKRIEEIKAVIEKSAVNLNNMKSAFDNAVNNHNSLLGRLGEATHLLTLASETAEEVVESVEPAKDNVSESYPT